MLIAAAAGFAFGFVSSMPIAGPIAALVFSRAVDNRIRSGLGIAVGASFGEAIYAFLTFLGFSTLLTEYEFITPVSQAAATVILLLLGVFFLLKKEAGEKETRDDAGSIGRDLLLGFTISALNPTFIVTYAAATATLFSSGLIEFKPWLAVPFTLGTIVGIVAWFSLLIFFLHYFKGRFTHRTLTRIVRVMGVLLIGGGLYFGFLFVQYLVAPG